MSAVVLARVCDCAIDARAAGVPCRGRIVERRTRARRNSRKRGLFTSLFEFAPEDLAFEIMAITAENDVAFLPSRMKFD
jgi:hypothetical protein